MIDISLVNTKNLIKIRRQFGEGHLKVINNRVFWELEGEENLFIIK